ncbi:MAG: hypothetical protein E6G97_01530 [Alphaproteobacteria bacterium]|nr:MAG: hypothetical protein E6G97_01530 [Alphaproteobacteria bacterium]
MAASRELHDLLARETGLDGDKIAGAHEADIMLPSGKAIAPRSAAACLLDAARTVAFLRGTEAALRTVLARFPQRPVEMLYAGCGPFAPFALMLATRFGPAQVRATLLDVNPSSLGCARALFETFGLTDFVRAYVCADAATYVWPRELPLHVVLVEAMQRALEHEPQVAISLNLAPQLTAGGILVPERIAVDLCLYDPAREFAAADSGDLSEARRIRVCLGTVLELTADSARALARATEYPAPVLDVPAETRHLPAMLRTAITAFGHHSIGEYASGLTNPFPLNGLAGARRIRTRYAGGPHPVFRCERMDEA